MTIIAMLIALSTTSSATFIERWPYEWEQFTPLYQHEDPLPTMHASGKSTISGRCVYFGRTLCIWDTARI